MPTPEYTQSEKPAIDLLEKLGYTYIDGTTLSSERENISEVLLKDRVEKAIKRLNPWLEDYQIAQAYREVNITSYESVMQANEAFWKKTLCIDEHTTQLEDLTNNKRKKDVKYIDFENPDNNEWLVVNQLKYKGKKANSIPDIVVYVNGFPLAVIECKSPSAPNAIDKAIAEVAIYYQENSEKLFIYNFIVAEKVPPKSDLTTVFGSQLFPYFVSNSDRGA